MPNLPAPQGLILHRSKGGSAVQDEAARGDVARTHRAEAAVRRVHSQMMDGYRQKILEGLVDPLVLEMEEAILSYYWGRIPFFRPHPIQRCRGARGRKRALQRFVQ